jgi:DNA-directed RNA polymerase specialized sigma24 family protein
VKPHFEDRFQSREDFRAWLGRLREHEHAAARDFTEDFGPRIRAVVRRILDRRVRSVEDWEDVEQNVFRDFFRDSLARYDFQRPGELQAFVECLAQRKAVRANRRWVLCRKRHPDQPLAALGGRDGEPASHEAGPLETVAASDELQHLSEQADELGRAVLWMCADGFSGPEIAHRLGVHERTVRKKRDSLYEVWRGAGAWADGPEGIRQTIRRPSMPLRHGPTRRGKMTG